MAKSFARLGQRFRCWCGAWLVLVMSVTLAAAEGTMQVRLPVVPDSLPGVVVRLPDGRDRMLTVAELESLGIREVRTTSPWEEGRIVVAGPLLRDVLAHVGLADAPGIVVRSMDDYAPVIPRADWQDYPVILATRFDGKPLGRRHKGPTRIVYPLLAFPELATAERDARWVWLIASIEAAE
jgi:hypothetical protein